MPAQLQGSRASATDAAPAADEPALDTTETACCVVGAGPAGAMLALLLARAAIPVVLLEEHGDFNRDFRGDTIHPSVMEILREIGLDRRLLELPHSELRTVTIQTAGGPLTPADFGLLKTPYPFVTLLPQTAFLAFITGEAARYPSFRLMLGARVEALVIEGGAVRGVRYRGPDGWHELRAQLVVGCDGRFSRLRRLGGFEAITTSPPIDVLWFRLPRRASDSPAGLLGRVHDGNFLAMLNRGEQWQIAFVIPKGGYQRLHAAGIAALRALVAETATELADRVAELADWKRVSLLSVASDRLRRWYRPGLLLIGDAAHTMSPVGGVGINYAIHDAVAATNILVQPLREGRVEPRHLAAVQRERELPTRLIQALQTLVQRAVTVRLFRVRGTPRVPAWVRLLVRLPGVRALGPRLIGIGFRPEHVAPALRIPTIEQPSTAHARP